MGTSKGTTWISSELQRWEISPQPQLFQGTHRLQNNGSCLENILSLQHSLDETKHQPV